MSATPPQLIKCPSCGATVEVVDAPSVQCRYCGTLVPIPAEYRPQKPQVVIQQVDTTAYTDYARQMSQSGRRVGCIITVVVLVFTLGIVGYSLFAATTTITSSVTIVQESVQQSLEQSGVNVELPGQKTNPDAPKPTPAFASIVLEFGGKGTGPGLMDDPRYIALDADGNIWTADYQDGRVQQFDPGGKFMTLIQVPADRNDSTLIRGLAADLKGNLYVSRGGDILKYDTKTGELLATFAGKFPDTLYDELTVDATNTLYALHTTASDNALIKLTADGKQLQRWDNIVTNVNKKDAAMNLDVAVDGLGNIAIVSSFGNQVYLYDKQGQFVDRFGQAGREPGQFNSPDKIAVDGQSRLYVGHTGGIDQFDSGGRYLGRLPIDYQKGAPTGLAVDRDGYIYLVTNQAKVLKYQLTAR